MEKPNTNVEISRLLEYGLQRGLIAPEDKAYAANRMLALLGLRAVSYTHLTLPTKA